MAEWARLHGDWSRGYCWTGSEGNLTTDVGGNLLGALERSHSSWTPLLRSNRVNPHPVWFGVYGNVVYHHGSGFRPAISRADLGERPTPSGRGRKLPLVGRPLRRYDTARRQHWEARRQRMAGRLGQEFFAKIQRDPHFYKELL